MRNQTKAAEQRFTRRHRVIGHVGAHIGVFMAPNEGAQVARPHIAPRQFAGQGHTEMLFQEGFVVDGFVVGAHAGTLIRRSHF